jgi:hypothetical protein
MLPRYVIFLQSLLSCAFLHFREKCVPMIMSSWR